MRNSGALLNYAFWVTPSAGAWYPLQPNFCGCYWDTRRFFLSPGLCKNKSFSNSKLEMGLEKMRTRSSVVRASGTMGDDLIPIAPLLLESPVGQLLSQMLRSHPHLVVAAAEQELENLHRQRDDGDETTTSSPKSNGTSASSDDILYKRIAEFKEKERRKVLEEIMYCLIVQRFSNGNISMIPAISKPSDPVERVDFWPSQEEKLESVHSPEAFEMIVSHLSLVLGERIAGPLDTIVQISKIKLGKLYAASVMYGYFLRRVDERYQLEQSMNILPEGLTEESETFQEKQQLWDPASLIQIYPEEDDVRVEERSSKLRSYVMYLDAETLQRYAMMRSKESLSLIEKQTQALFGRPDISVSEDGSLDAANDEPVSITFSGLTLLILEAVTFGSFLWDTETFVESKYPFINS